MFHGAAPAKKTGCTAASAAHTSKKWQAPDLPSAMATVGSSERAYASAPDTPTGIWDTVEPRGVIKRKRVLICAGISVLCGAVLALALFFGLSESLEDEGAAGQISSQATSSTDHNALGCFQDSQTNRTLVLEVVDADEMTPDVSEML